MFQGGTLKGGSTLDIPIFITVQKSTSARLYIDETQKLARRLQKKKILNSRFVLMHFVFLLPMCLNWDLRIKGLPGLLNPFPCVYPCGCSPLGVRGARRGSDVRPIHCSACLRGMSVQLFHVRPHFYVLKGPILPIH